MAIKWLDRGYWVSKHFYWQSMVHYLWYSAKHGSMTFFSAANPAIPFGGMLDESKEAIDAMIPASYRPTTIVYDPRHSLASQLLTANLSYPLIIKPDIGLKGHQVHKVVDEQAAQALLHQLDASRSWLLQEYVAYKKEFALLYYRYPTEGGYGVLSLIEKCYPTVTGDGRRNLGQLIREHPHPYLDKESVLEQLVTDLLLVPAEGQRITIGHVGNYGKGATFRSMMDTVSPAFAARCHAMFAEMKDLYFYRLDLKADSIEALLAGQYTIIEINGTKGEPLHIYDRQHSWWHNTRDIYRHWRIMSNISGQMLTTGYVLPSFREGMAAVWSLKRMLS